MLPPEQLPAAYAKAAKERQCLGTKPDGTRCRKPARKGYRFCRSHAPAGEKPPLLVADKWQLRRAWRIEFERRKLGISTRTRQPMPELLPIGDATEDEKRLAAQHARQRHARHYKAKRRANSDLATTDAWRLAETLPAERKARVKAQCTDAYRCMQRGDPAKWLELQEELGLA